MPHQFNTARRHKFDKAWYRMINWATYNESLRQRGALDLATRMLELSQVMTHEWMAVKQCVEEGPPPSLVR